MKASTQADWVTQMLIDTGRMDAAGLTRKARLRTCMACRRSTLAGLDGRVAGLSVWCDLTELSALGEAMALIDGRATYEVWDATVRPELERRDVWRVRAHPPGSEGCRPVLAEHRCGAPVPADWAMPKVVGQPAPLEAAPEFPF